MKGIVKEIIRKLGSRKLWTAAVGIAVGIIVAFGGDGEAVERVAGNAMSVITAVVYILAEAGVDISRKNEVEVRNDEALRDRCV